MSLVARGVFVRAGQAHLLEAVDLEAHPGELLAIVGPNGAGKSTLLSVLSGERRPDAGEVSILGTPLERHGARELARRRAFLRQSFSVWVDVPVLDVVLLGRVSHPGRGLCAADRELARALLDEVGLSGFGSRRYQTLSGGERQRVHLARVLAQLDGTLGVLLLDEPSASLDPRLAHDVLALVRRRIQTGLVAIAVLHDLTLALRYADRVLALDAGRVAACAPVERFPAEVVERLFELRVEELSPRHGRRRWWLEPAEEASSGETESGAHSPNARERDLSEPCSRIA